MRRRDAVSYPGDASYTGPWPARARRAAACACVVVLAALGAHGAFATSLSAAEARGKRIYFEGVSEAGRDITALAAGGTVPVPAAVLPCAGCHGEDGRGRAEGGVVPSDVNWRALTAPYGHNHAYGRTHAPFDERSLARAIITGVDPAGNRLDPAMPRYDMAQADVADLIAYLKRIEFDLDPGLGDSTIRIGTLLPREGRLASIGQAMQAVLEAFFSDINAGGGINGRRLELVSGDYAADATRSVWNARDLLRTEPVFALVSGYVTGIEEEMSALAEEEQLPLVGPFTPFAQADADANRFTFYLLAGFTQQVRALAKYIDQALGIERPRVAIAYAQNERYQALALSLRAQGEERGWPQVLTLSHAPGRFDAVDTARTLHEERADVLFFLGGAAELARLAAEAERIGWAPYLFLPGAFASKAIFDIPVAFAHRVYISYPSVPADHTPQGVDDFEALHANHRIDYRHSAAQISAYTAAMILVEGLKRAGRNLSRERLIAALEGLTEFQAGLVPAISYNTTRRIGALGAYVVAVDLARRGFAPTSKWIALE